MPPSLNLNSENIQSELNVYYCVHAAAFTILFYDYLITLNWEISRYWFTHPSAPTILFFLNRYGTLLGNIPVAVMDFWTATPGAQKTAVCHTLNLYHELFVVGIQVVIGLLLILRTYALYARSRWILVFMIAFSFGTLGTGIVGIHATNSLPQEFHGTALSIPIGCAYAITQRETPGLMLAWGAMGLFDVMIFVLTLYRTMLNVRGRGLKRLNLVTLMMRDGCLYFGAMVLCNIGNLLTLALGGEITRGILNTFTNVVSSVLISRLMFNLRDPELRSGDHHANPKPPRAAADWGSSGVFSSYLDLENSGGLPAKSRCDSI